jgi:hypothetical protein
MPTISQVFLGFTEYLLANAGSMPYMTQDRFLPHPFQFTTHHHLVTRRHLVYGRGAQTPTSARPNDSMYGGLQYFQKNCYRFVLTFKNFSSLNTHQAETPSVNSRSQVTSELWILNIKPPSYHPSLTYALEVAPRCLKTLDH